MSGIIGAGAVRKSGIIGAFPDGHIIQIVTGTSTTYVQSGGGSSNVWGDTGGIPSVTITPTIGASDDGSYADGLFTTFNYSTSIGTVVDKFNEVLLSFSIFSTLVLVLVLLLNDCPILISAEIINC